jgi:hypothetical protein
VGLVLSSILILVYRQEAKPIDARVGYLVRELVVSCHGNVAKDVRRHAHLAFKGGLATIHNILRLYIYI